MKKFLTLRVKIFLVYIILLIVTLSIFSISIYLGFRDSLYAKLDALLAAKAEGIRNSIETYWTARQMVKNGTPESFNDFLKKQLQFEVVTQRLTHQDNGSLQELKDFEVSIFDAKGILIDSSKTLSQIDYMRQNLINYYFPRFTPNFGSLNMQTEEGKMLSFRTLTIPVKEGREKYQVKYIVQVITSLSSLEDELNHFKRIFWFRIPLVILVAGIACFQVVRITLNPLKGLISKITEINPENLQMRIDIPEHTDEFASLAERFNEMLDKMDRSFAAQRRIIQDVSHELKTPLTIIMGELEVALKKMRDPEEYHAILASCFEESKKIKGIIDDILMLARLDTTALTKEDMKPIDLYVLLKQVLEDIKVLAKDKEIQIIFLARSEMRMNANETLLKRLFANLLENAVKYTPPQGRIRVGLDEDDRFVMVEITDNGVGIPEEDLPYIFDRFYRVDKARVGEGIGVGLSIAKSIVEAHQGSIRVESKLGLETTFKIFFPRSSVLKLLS